MQAEVLEKIKSMAKEVSDSEGCVLYDLEFIGGPQGRVLRVFIDRVEGQVSIDDCANVSRGLNSLLDSSDDMISDSSYELEVSSPGIERKLTEPWHFERAVGQPIKVKLTEPMTMGSVGHAPRGTIEGDLIEFSNGELTILLDGQNWKVPVQNVAKANVRFKAPEKNIKGKKKR